MKLFNLSKNLFFKYCEIIISYIENDLESDVRATLINFDLFLRRNQSNIKRYNEFLVPVFLFIIIILLIKLICKIF